jgi:hypothetical protein
MNYLVKVKQPDNETKAHFKLKEIGKYVLFQMGYKRFATEVYGMNGFDYKHSRKTIIDIVGVKSERKGKEYIWKACGIEAKASLSDFRNGFCSATALTYIIAPKGIIPLTELPKDVGLIEVDFSTLRIKQFSTKLDDLQGVKIVKRARSHIDSRFSSKESYHKWCATLLERISYRSSAELLFKRSILKLH